MLSKKPIIASKVSAMPEIIKNNYNGFLIKPNNPKLLAKTIRKFKNKNLRNKLGIMDFITLKNFKVDKMYKEIQEVRKMTNNNFKSVIKDFGDEWDKFGINNKLDEKELKKFLIIILKFFQKYLNKKSLGIDIGSGSGRWAKFVL